ncbi:ABC transporter [Clostridium acidisoli DSM 12555]|uniref:ABC transporter n=1 Tax=Clostridium acidisoli DSM 12555 TaxID=1121291 RepID=A0A1W1XY41_9CLOT|nr:ABC-F family ATP-binding cassette domain-containing protein [Clostridium acidisoli]SMC28843.1 ABC transporter [Clostridium acidisoli DSM 12555]
MYVKFNELSKLYGEKYILKDVCGEIQKNEKIGLIGSNGTGKTTLSKIITGILEYDSGKVEYTSSNIKIEYLSQFYEGLKDISVNNDILNKFKRNKDKEIKFKKSLEASGFTKDKWVNKINTLSGGEKTKLMLCEIFTKDFDIIILDEPTNHMDIYGQKWLENKINKLNKTVIIISHDRYFLDNTVSIIWELSHIGLKKYNGNYSSYKLQKEEEEKSIFKEYEKQDKKIKHLNKIIDERKIWFEKAHKAAGQNDFLRSKAKKHVSVLRAKEKELERIEKERVEKPKKTVPPYFNIINKKFINKKTPKFLIKVIGLNKKYKENIFEDVSFNMMKGDKIALIGNNGTGKSTLLKILKGIDKDYTGELNVNPSLSIGYFSQELDNLYYNKSVIENVILSNNINLTEARNLLASLLFRGNDIYKEVKDLSMGEKARVSFAKIILEGVNVLVLDEPTNYMDIESKEALEEVFKEFMGCIIFASHDRYFINAISNKILEFNNGTIDVYNGNYKNYLNRDKNMKSSENRKQIKDNIRILECELSFLSGKLDEKLGEGEKQVLTNKFLERARELNVLKNKIK